MFNGPPVLDEQRAQFLTGDRPASWDLETWGSHDVLWKQSRITCYGRQTGSGPSDPSAVPAVAQLLGCCEKTGCMI